MTISLLANLKPLHAALIAVFSTLFFNLIMFFLWYFLYFKKNQLKKNKINAQKEFKKINNKFNFLLEDFNTVKENFIENYNKKKNWLRTFEEELLMKKNSLKKQIDEIKNQETKNLLFEKELNNKKSLLDQKILKINKSLLKISNYSMEEAKEKLFNNLKEEFDEELSIEVKKYKNDLKNKLKHIKIETISNAVNKVSQKEINDFSITVVNLPNEDLKGKIVGKKGRNIKSFKLISGVDLIIDDTLRQVKLSSFNSLRREIAYQTLKDLIEDGRIQPAKIEEYWNKNFKNSKDIIFNIGKEVIENLNIKSIHDEIISLLGQLKYRTSYGQNTLNHCIEVAEIAGFMAEELNLNKQIAIRAGLLHDIGKAIVGYDISGSHVEYGVKIAKKYNESDIVINAIHSHHGDVEFNNVYSVLVSAADSISASRPGARSNSLEEFIQRMSKIEEKCNSIEGIEKTYALQSGRKILIMVNPEQITDNALHNVMNKVKEVLSEDENIWIPGDINISIIRNTVFEDKFMFAAKKTDNDFIVFDNQEKIKDLDKEIIFDKKKN